MTKQRLHEFLYIALVNFIIWCGIIGAVVYLKNLGVFTKTHVQESVLLNSKPLQTATPLQTASPLQPAGPLQGALPLQMIVPPSDFGGAQGLNTSLKWSGNIESLPDFLNVLNRIVITEWPDGTNSYTLLPQVVGNLTKDSVYTPEILKAAVDKIVSLPVTLTPSPGFNPIPPPIGLPPIFIPNQNQASPR